MLRVRNIVPVVILLITAWLGWNTYAYFFDKRVPTLQVSGLDNGMYVAGDAQCHIVSDKSGEICVWLDGTPLVNKFSLRSKHEHPFVIPTKTLSNGKHDMKIELKDSSYNRNKNVVERSFYVDNLPLQAAFVKQDTDSKVLQGRTLHLQFQVNKELQEAKVHALSGTYDCFPESPNSQIYECFIPISCEEIPNEYLLNVELKDLVGNELHLETKFQVVMFPFKKQTLQVSADKLAEEKRLADDMSSLEELLTELSLKSPREKLWRGSFCAPIDIVKVTCDFGTIRTTQEKGRYMHKAVDVINMPRSVVWATADGIVVVKHRYANSGNTVVIDHGWGVLSMFFHLDTFANINVGDKVRQGSPIGTLGKTGYSTGYHLHWEMRLPKMEGTKQVCTAVDPLQWTKPNF